MAAGIGLRRIAELAQLPYGTVASLVYGSPRTGRTPSGRIRPHTATQLLAIAASTDARAPGALVDATGTRLRLQSLVLNGWSLAGLARQLGRSPDHLPSVLKAATVTIATAQAVRALFDELWDMAPPTRTHAERITATKSRNRAARQGWLPAMAWDDLDDGTQPPLPDVDGCGPDIDEIAVERAMGGDHVRLTRVERDEAVRRLTSKGYSVRQIAERLGTTTRTVMRRRAADRAA
jgi:lambda repressor-like predicted transcriptional regulator